MISLYFSFNGKVTTDIVIVGGYGNGYINHVQLIRIKDDGGIKRVWYAFPEYPFAIRDHAGSILNNEVIICGGFGYTPWLRNAATKINDCYKINDTRIEWTKMAPMKSKRILHAMVSLQDKIIITGGVYGRKVNGSTEKHSNNQWNYAQNMPKGLQGHCMVALDSNTAMIIGGVENGLYENRTVSK